MKQQATALAVMLVTATVSAEKHTQIPHTPLPAHIRRPDLYEPRHDVIKKRLAASDVLTYDEIMEDARNPHDAGLKPKY